MTFFYTYIYIQISVIEFRPFTQDARGPVDPSHTEEEADGEERPTAHGDGETLR